MTPDEGTGGQSRALRDEGLARRLKALACTAPLHDLDARKVRLDWCEASVYQMAEVALQVIDQVTIAMDFDHGAGHDDVVKRVLPFIAAQASGRDSDEHASVAQWVLDNLINVGSAERGFRSLYGTFGESGSYERRVFDFKLIIELVSPEGEIYLRASDEAINVLVGALDTDVESAQIAAEVKLANLVKRGRLSDAQLAAQQARYRTVQYAETLRRKLDATKRDVRSVDWECEVPDLIDEALTHIEGRYRYENAILVNITQAREDATDPVHKLRAAELVQIVTDCMRRHTQLQARLQEAGTTFRAEQDRQQFSGRARRATVDLFGHLLSPALSFPVADAIGPALAFFSGAAGLALPRSLRVKQLGEREKEKREAHLALVNTEKQLRAQLPGMNKAAGITKDRARSLTMLAERYAQIPGWQEVIRASREVITSTESEATRAHERAEALRHQQAEARRKADDNRRVATGCRDQLRGIPGGGSVDEAMPVPDKSTESLRSTYWALELAYAKVEVGADLRSELSGRDHTEAEALAAVKRIDQSVLDRAAALLRTPDGGDAAARAAATERTRRLAADLESQVTRSAGEEGKRKETYERIQPQERSLEPYGPPRDIPHGKELIAAATQDRETAGDALEEVQHRKSALTDELAGAKQAISGFSAIRESLAGIVPILDPESAEPFSGVVEAARARRDRVRETSNEAARLLTGATDQVRRAADQLANHTSDERYEKVTSPVRRQMMATSRERLPEFAEEWETNLKPRLRVLSDELEQIERHRAAIITRLGGMVAYALGRLRAAQKASRLPDGLGDWSGLEFLRIAFTQPDEAVLTERIGQVVDDASGADGGKRDGLSLLLAGIHAAVRPKGVRVDMLKPDAVLRDERVRVSEIGDVFSGGQLLTAAIILYCTMASLRAAERGQARRQHAGVLFLDNPIGRASAGYLLELQLAVADKLHVQLVYTTGLFDTSALSVFPLILRLRNDADLRAGMKYLSVDSSIRAGLPADPPDGTGTLTASRVYSRPTA